MWTIAGTIFGLAAGAILAEKAEIGDQFGAGILVLIFWGLSGALGALAGAFTSAVRATLVGGRGWEKAVALLIFAIPLFFFWYNTWESVVRAGYLPKNCAAQAELRNAKTCLEAYYMDNRIYPASFDQTGCTQAKDVEIEYVRTSPDKCKLRSLTRRQTRNTGVIRKRHLSGGDTKTIPMQSGNCSKQ